MITGVKTQNLVHCWTQAKDELGFLEDYDGYLHPRETLSEDPTNILHAIYPEEREDGKGSIIPPSDHAMLFISAIGAWYAISVPTDLCGTSSTEDRPRENEDSTVLQASLGPLLRLTRDSEDQTAVNQVNQLPPPSTPATSTSTSTSQTSPIQAQPLPQIEHVHQPFPPLRRSESGRSAPEITRESRAHHPYKYSSKVPSRLQQSWKPHCLSPQRGE